MSKLHIDSIRKTFGGKQILTDVYLSCKAGEIIGLLGRNGSGKSTLLKIIFGSMPADGKFIRVDSQLLNSINQKRNLISYLPQESFLPSQLKIRTAIKLFCSASNASKLFSNQLMRPFLNKKTSQLSGGEQRLAEVLLIIHSPAKFILIDEPFNGIAPLYKDELKALITELAINKGFIITDHDHKNIIDISSRIILLFDGGTKEISTKKELLEWGYLPIVK